MQTRIVEIEEIIAKAKVVANKKAGTSVGMGSVVTLMLEGKAKKITVTIVGEFESDPDSGKVSSVSPMGKAIMGKNKGDTVTVKAPAGEIAYIITDIK